MNGYEKGIRERYEVESFEGVKIDTIQEGRDLCEQIDRLMAQGINEMRESNLNNMQSECWNNVMYDLKTARHKIQKQLAVLVKLNMKNRSIA